MLCDLFQGFERLKIIFVYGFSPPEFKSAMGT